jgi:hypothetical protein
MTLTQVAQKFNISEAFLNSKDDALIVAASSIQDIVRGMRDRNGDQTVMKQLELLAEFLREVKNSGI